MANIRVVKTTVDDSAADTTIKPEAVGGDNQARQLWQGPGILLAMSLNRTDSSGLVTTIYDSATGDSAAPTIYTQTGDADLGLTVPVVLYGDADLVAGTSTAGVGPGLIFADGMFLVNSGDTTDTAVAYTFWVKPLIKKSVNVGNASATVTSPIWHGPALWHGYRIKLDPASATLGTLYITFTDEASPGDSGPTVMTKTNYATLGPTLRKVTTTTGEDEAGAAVTAAATGSYGTPGIYLRDGLSVNIAQASSVTREVELHCLFEK